MSEMPSVHELMKKAEGNFAIFDGFAKAYSVLSKHYNLAVSVSGGRDSDVVVDIISRLDTEKKCRYVWFNTGLEYQATKDHLKDLENKYGITIDRERALKSIPASCREFGQPFLSKFVSGAVNGLQNNGFKFEDKPFEELCAEYPKVKSYIKWWCNVYQPEHSQYNIRRNKWLKEFMILYPPQFKISKKCCDFAKKDVSKAYIKKYDVDCMITGIRKAEGGVRASRYKTCFNFNADGYDQYRPIFWYSNEDERFYIELFDVVSSDCYVVYGMVRTGCGGCPFNKDLARDLEIMRRYEPKLYMAVQNVFRDSYEYTAKYRAFCEEMEKRHGSYKQYLASKSGRD